MFQFPIRCSHLPRYPHIPQKDRLSNPRPPMPGGGDQHRDGRRAIRHKPDRP